MAKQPIAHSSLYNTSQKVEGYWNQFKPTTAVNESYKDKWLAQTFLFDVLSLQNRVCITLWDVVSNRFIYASDPTGVLGENAKNFVNENGVDFTMSHFPAKYLDGTLKCQAKMVEYCMAHPEYSPFQIIGNFDTQYHTNRGDIHFLQQTSVVESTNDGSPLLFFSYIYDITHLKKEPALSIVISSPAERQIWRYNFNNKKLTEIELTAKEEEVLQHLATGRHSKEIATAMKISPNTADTHRRRLLSKTCCVDTTALISYCRMVGII
jgi:DNA-binding CsgD family transcriptional regulator